MSRMGSAQEIGTIKLPERLDSTTAGAAEETLRAAMRPGAKLIVDGSEVIYMSAAGVRALASVLHGAQSMNARVVFCRFGGAASDCLEVSGFAQLLDVADSVEEASARLTLPGTGSSNRLHPRHPAG
jgi:anti-sigma B factor antagonist